MKEVGDEQGNRRKDVVFTETKQNRRLQNPRPVIRFPPCWEKRLLGQIVRIPLEEHKRDTNGDFVVPVNVLGSNLEIARQLVADLSSQDLLSLGQVVLMRLNLEDLFRLIVWIIRERALYPTLKRIFEREVS